MKTFAFFALAALVILLAGILVERRERKKPPAFDLGPFVIRDVIVVERPPCKLQMDKTKPNYNDCGAFREPVSPTSDSDGVPTGEAAKWFFDNSKLKPIPPPKDKK